MQEESTAGVGYLCGQLSKEYIYSGSRMLATIAGAAITYHHPDHLSSRAETDATGTATRTFGSFPYGEMWYETGTPDKWKFTSYERDSGMGETGLDYADFRYYSAGQGRFTSADPLDGHLGTPQSFNRDAFVLDDPVNNIDPMGLSSFTICSSTLVTVTITSTDPNGNKTTSKSHHTQLDGCVDITTSDPGPVAGGGGGGGRRAPRAIKKCIPVSALGSLASSPELAAGLYSAYLASRAAAWLTGGTVGVGWGGGAGFGIGPEGTAAVGGSVSGSLVFTTDALGNSAVVLSATPPVQLSGMSTNPNWSDAGAAAMGGIQITASSSVVPTTITLSGSADINGSYGPIGFDWTPDSVSLLVGPGVGARIGGSVGGTLSLSIPICK